MGKIIEFFQYMPRFLESALVKPQTWVIIFVVASAITFVSLSKSQKAEQRAMVRKVKAVKKAQKAYSREKDLSKLPKKQKKYNKTLKALKRRISYALWWNKKRIILSSPYLLDTSEKANLALEGNKPFTFKDVLNEIVEAKNKKRKHKTQIIEKNKTIGEVATKTTKQVVETKQIVEVKTLKQDERKLDSIKVEENKVLSNMSSIYKAQTEKELEK